LIDYASSENKGYSAHPKKKAHRIGDKIIVVIDQSLVKRLAINDDTWFEQQAVDVGILLRIYRPPTTQRENNTVTDNKEKKIYPQQAQQKQSLNQIDPITTDLNILDDDYMMSSPFRICKECGNDHSFRPNFKSVKTSNDIILQLLHKKNNLTSKPIRELDD
jgi:hypothetical protein